MGTVVSEIADGRATITLNNQELRNALTVEVAEELQAAIDEVSESDARCVVVQGSDGYFCAGGDIEAMLEGVTGNLSTSEKIEGYARPINEAVQAVAECPLPTVAKVDGPAFGAGGALALACDIVLASERAKISFGFRQVGLSVDSGTSALLPRVVGENIAKELVYTGELVEPDRAVELGLFNRVFETTEFDRRAEEVVERIATGPTLALEHSKQLLEAGHRRTVAEAIDAELDAIETIAETDDHEEGVRAFVERRDPSFDGR